MQKCLIFLLALLSLTVQAKAEWNPYIMNHERFVHLNDEDKQTLIIRTMEMMVELEAKYAKETKVSGFSAERFQKYVRIINQMRSFLISEAIAAPGKAGFPQLGREFTTILNDQKEKGCIYGGWASEIVQLNGSSVCKHPSMSSNKKIRAAYLNENGSCTGPEKISCNPLVFGFKKAKGEVAFCVDTGYTKTKENKAHNVSYECMRAALQVEKVPEGQDSKEARLLYMSKAMSAEANKEAFNSVHSQIFQTCACAKGQMNQDYMDYIRPHRTCFGMMNSLRAFKSTECEGLVATIPKENTEFLTKWNNFFSDSNIKKLDVPKTKHPGPFDDQYNMLINDKAVQQYCKGEVPPPIIVTPVLPEKSVVCTSKCAPMEGAPGKYLCEVATAVLKIKENGVEREEAIDLATLKLKELKDVTPEMDKLPIELADGTKASCPIKIEVKKDLDKKECAIAVADAKDDTKKSVATLSFNGYSDKEKPINIVWKPAGTPNEKNPLEMTFAKTDADQPLVVTYAIEGMAAPKEPLSCSTSIPKLGEKTDDAIPTIDTEAEAATATSVKVNAKVMLGDKDITADLGKYHISWIRSKDGGKTPQKKEVKKSANNTGLEEEVDLVDAKIKEQEAKIEKLKKEIKDDKDSKKQTKLKEELQAAEKTLEDLKKEKSASTEATAQGTTEVKPAEGEFSQDVSVTETRLAEVYEACASLIDDKGVSVAGPSCKPIPPLEAAKPVNNTNNNYNPGQNSAPPSFQLPVYNTRQMGIQ